MIKILALDTSTTATGWAIFNNEHYKKSGCINLKTSNKTPKERIAMMCKSVLDLLNEENPDIVVVEKLSVERNFKTVVALCRVLDVCYVYSLMNDSNFYEMSPSEWRKLLGMQISKGQRIAYKQMGKDFVANEFVDKEMTNDESDAICLGAAFINDYIAPGKYHYEAKE